MIDKRPMKLENLVYTAEKIGLGLFIIAILFKVQHWAYAGLLILGALSIFIVEFIALGLFYNLPNEYGKRWRWLFKAAAVSSAIGVTGILFLMQHWPYGYLIVLLSTSALLFGLVAYFTDPTEEPNKMYRKVCRVAIIIGAVNTWSLVSNLVLT